MIQALTQTNGLDAFLSGAKVNMPNSEYKGTSFQDVMKEIDQKPSQRDEKGIQLEKRADFVDKKESKGNDKTKKEIQNLEAKSVNESEKSESNQPTDKTEEISDEILEEEAAGLATSMIPALQEFLMNTLQITSEQLQEAMDTLGITPPELAQTDKLQSLVLYVTDKNQMDLVVEEDFRTQMDMILHTGNEILQGSEVYQESVVNALETEEPKILNTELPDMENNSDDIADLEPEIKMSREMIETKAESDEPELAENQSMPKVTVDVQNIPKAEISGKGKHQGVTNFEDAKQQIFERISQAVQDTQLPEEVTPQVRSHEILQQVLEQVKVQLHQDSQSMEMQLYPEHLGKIQIHVVAKDGVLTAQIQAETDIAKEAIENNIQQLKDTLEQQNLKVESVEVSVGLSAFNQNSAKDGAPKDAKESARQTRTRRLRLEDIDESDLSQEEELAVAMMQANGTNVDFTA